jgi:endonuclease/exonuclease/phosphatase (EEP) superfamily protein YafD
MALLLLVALLRGVGERWWLTTVGLYLPCLLYALPLPVVALLLWRRRARWLWFSQVAALVVLLFPLGGLVLPRRVARDGRSPMIRVLSYNVMHAYAGPERIMAEIDRFAPDVVLMVKLGANQEPMQRLLLRRYPHVSISGGGVVASRFPFLSSFEPDVPQPPELGARARFAQKVIQTPLGPIAFHVFHPQSPRDGLLAVARLKKGSVTLVRTETEWRVRQVRRLAARARSETLPVVIGGDSNLAHLSPLLHDELGRYRDAFREAGWGFGYTYPHNLFRWMRIDRILASDQLRVVGFQRGDSTASDHVCVVADLQRR